MAKQESSQNSQLVYTVHPLLLLVEAIGFTVVFCIIAAMNSTQFSTSSPLQLSADDQPAQVESVKATPALY
jgi:hypothetical protein